MPHYAQRNYIAADRYLCALVEYSWFYTQHNCNASITDEFLSRYEVGQLMGGN